MIKSDKALILFCDSSSGKYIPKRFAQEIKRELVSGISENDYNEILDPENEFYWETWDHVCNNAVITSVQGNKYYLWQDGDLWLVCDDLMTEQEKLDFFGEC